MGNKTAKKRKPFDPDELNELFGLTVVKTVRIPTELCQQVESWAKKTGSNFNDTVITALRAHIGLPSEAGVLFIHRIFDWVVKTYKKSEFPENVTHKAFQHIQNTPELLKEYQQITMQRENKEIINRRIGKMVKQALDAEVVGRSLPLGKEELITTYALLRPKT